MAFALSVSKSAAQVGSASASLTKTKMSNPNIVSSGFSAPLAVKLVAWPTTAEGSFWVIEMVSPSACAVAAENPIAAGTSSPSVRSRRNVVGPARARVRVMRRTVKSAAQRTLNGRSASSGTLAGLSSRSVEFLILGPLEARIDGHAVGLGPPRQRLLVAALLLAAPTALRREQLIDEVWGAEPPASARHAVEVYVSRLRQSLGAEAIAGGPGASYAVAT